MVVGGVVGGFRCITEFSLAEAEAVTKMAELYRIDRLTNIVSYRGF